MWLWWFMFVIDLLIPVMMIGFAGLWRNNPPGEVNWMYGYRTKRSTRNQDTWEFAHQYVSRLWWKWGWGLFAITLILFAFLWDRYDSSTTGLIGAYYCLGECIPLIAIVIPTERALKKNFDSHGQRILQPGETTADGAVAARQDTGKNTPIKIPSGYEIRKMELEDWTDVQEIYAQGMEEGMSTFSTHLPDFTTWDEAHLSDCRYIITNGQRVAGWCAISSMSAKQAYWGTVEVSIYIDKNHRRMGLGQALLQHLCIESEKLGYWSLYSCICAQNEGSIAMHKRCGFRVIGRREAVAKDRFDVWQDTVLMERRSKKIK